MDQETVDEIKRHFGVVVEDVRGDIRAVAEGLDLLRERFDGFEMRVDEQFRGVGEQFRLVGVEFREVKAMIRLSYAEIDRRFQTLETDVASLRARVDRIESAR
jgi:hypothetical protein